tara:strand:+ start:314 stop:553 length:240 start_codon:yes stop_codon:yes gene_type:complete
MEHEVNIHEAMLNSYDVAINNISAEDIIERHNGWFAHDVSSPISKYDLESLLIYFEDEEDYERCIKIRDHIKDVSSTRQ